MEGERRILQDRVEPVPVGRRRIEPHERVGRGDDEEQKGHGDRGLHGEHVGFELGGRFVPNSATAAPNSARISTHEQHRAFMVPPDARDLVEERLRPNGSCPDVGDREVRRHVGVHQRRERDRDQQKLQARPARHRRQSSVRGGARPSGTPPAPWRRAVRESARNGRDSAIISLLRSRASFILPAWCAPAPHAFRLKRLRNVGRHVRLVVLGEHAVGFETAVPSSGLRRRRPAPRERDRAERR